MNPAAPIHPEVLAEAQEVIDVLSRDMVAAQAEARGAGVSPQRINALFRSGHTLKGLVGLFGLRDALRLAHAMEDVLEAARMGRLALTPQALHLLLSCVEHLLAQVGEAALGQGTNRVEAGADLIEQLHRLQSLPPAPAAGPDVDSVRPPKAEADPVLAADPAAADAMQGADAAQLAPEMRRMLTEYEAYRLAENLRLGVCVVCAQVQLSLLTCDVDLAALESALGAMGEIIARLPSAVPGPEAALIFDLLVATPHPMAELVQQLARPDVHVRRIGADAAASPPAPSLTAAPASAAQPGGDPVASAPAAAANAPLPASPPRPDVTAAAGQDSAIALQAQTVRVDIRRLDTLMHMVGELNLTRVALDGISLALRHKPGLQALVADLDRERGRLERRVTALQSTVLQARMVPLAALFDRLVRMGTKVAGDVGVEVQFALEGAATELDKRIVEELADPLAHLVRNAVDHGIEAPTDRRARGKPAFGTVTLSAWGQGNQVQVQVRDDGYGMDLAKIREVALRRNLATAARLMEMSIAQVLRLVLLPGFSTRSEVSAISGRGVGLDVVKTHIERLGGSVDIATEAGGGTTFILTAPVTLAILPALVVAVGAATYAIPLAHVVEALGIEPGMRRRGQGLPMLQVRDATLVLQPLAHLLTAASPGAAAENDVAVAAAFAVVVGLPGRRIALAVDDVVGQQDIVIKPLGPRLAHLHGIAGAAELDDRSLILVLDVMALLGELERAELGAGAHASAHASGHAAALASMVHADG